jgi:hypothetical protein
VKIAPCCLVIGDGVIFSSGPLSRASAASQPESVVIMVDEAYRKFSRRMEKAQGDASVKDSLGGPFDSFLASMECEERPLAHYGIGTNIVHDYATIRQRFRFAALRLGRSSATAMRWCPMAGQNTPVMKKPTPIPKEALALLRHEIVCHIKILRGERLPLVQCARTASLRPWPGEGERYFAARTLET